MVQCENKEYEYISGLEFFKFKTDDAIIDYISPLGNNMVPFDIILGERFTYLFYNRYKFFENDKIEEGSLLNVKGGGLDPHD